VSVIFCTKQQRLYSDSNVSLSMYHDFDVHFIPLLHRCIANWPIAEAPEAAPTVKSREITLNISNIRDVLYRHHIVCRFLQTIWQLYRSSLSYTFTQKHRSLFKKCIIKHCCLPKQNAQISEKMADNVISDITGMTLRIGVIWLVKRFFSDRSIDKRYVADSYWRHCEKLSICS